MRLDRRDGFAKRLSLSRAHGCVESVSHDVAGRVTVGYELAVEGRLQLIPAGFVSEFCYQHSDAIALHPLKVGSIAAWAVS